MTRGEVMIERIEKLENEVNILSELLNMVDNYSKHFMSQTLTILAIVISIAGIIIVGAMYFMIKSMINQKMDKEVERRILKILGEQPPVYYANGKDKPNENGELILSTEIIGIEDLEPRTLLLMDVKVEHSTWDQLGKPLNYGLTINQLGERVITIENYEYSDEPDKGNGSVSWVIVWIRKYSK